jgi:hypothetical protein
MSEELLNEILRNANRNNLFKAIVDGARDRGSLLQVHADRRSLDSGRIGFVLESGDDGFTFQELDDEGEPDGVVTITFRSVIELRERSREICRLQTLHRANNEMLVHGEDDHSYSSAGVIRNRLEAAQANNALIEVRLETENDVRHIRGFVHSVSRDFVQLNVVTYNGDPDGTATIKLNDVSTIFEDDWEIRRARRLYENRAGMYDSAEFEAGPSSPLQ